VSSGTSGTVRYGESASDSGDSSTSPNDAYLASGSGSGTVVLHNLGAGSLASGSTDAVNGAQINTLASSVASALGGGSTFDSSTGTLTSPSYTIQGTSYSTVGGALSAVDSSLSNLGTATTNLQNQINENREIAAGGIASALAASQLRYNNLPGRLALSVAGGYFDGQGAMAFGGGMTTLDYRWQLSGALTYAPGVGKIGGSAGAAYRF
jgi:trimeric autotransporter adhesin